MQSRRLQIVEVFAEAAESGNMVALMRGIHPAYIANQAGHSVTMLLEKYARWFPGAEEAGSGVF